MLTPLNALKPNRPKENSKTKKRILCIIEGNLELEYIVKIFKLFGYAGNCFELTEEHIRVAWGKKLAKHQNIVQETRKGCYFEGGSHKGSKVPFPAISAFELYNRDIAFFDSVIVFFDSDKDVENEVQNYFKNKFGNLAIQNVLLVSTPCFESTLIDFCFCGNCRDVINQVAEGKEACSKYKDSLASLECFKDFKTGKGIVANLKITDRDTLKNVELIQVNKLIQNYMSKI